MRLRQRRDSNPQYPRPSLEPLRRGSPFRTFSVSRLGSFSATLALSVFYLTGCNGTLPAVPKEVRIPVPVACISQADIPQATFATDAELAALPDGPFVLALARDRLERQGHISSLEAILQGCAKKSPAENGAKPTGEK